MTNETDDRADAAPEPDGGEQAPTLFQIRDQLFRHRMTLKQLDFQVMTPEERLTITVVNILSTGFALLVVAVGIGFLIGAVSFSEAVALVQDFFIVMGIIGALIIALLCAISSSFGLVETLKRLREGPPEPVYDIEELEAEATEGESHEQASKSE